MNEAVFPRAYTNLSGESEMMDTQMVRPAFPRRSTLVDAVLGVDSWDGRGAHPSGAEALTESEKRKFNFWVLLGAQYK
jgi:hypothetical protein